MCVVQTNITCGIIAFGLLLLPVVVYSFGRNTWWQSGASACSALNICLVRMANHRGVFASGVAVVSFIPVYTISFCVAAHGV